MTLLLVPKKHLPTRSVKKRNSFSRTFICTQEDFDFRVIVPDNEKKDFLGYREDQRLGRFFNTLLRSLYSFFGDSTFIRLSISANVLPGEKCVVFENRFQLFLEITYHASSEIISSDLLYDHNIREFLFSFKKNPSDFLSWNEEDWILFLDSFFEKKFKDWALKLTERKRLTEDALSFIESLKT